MRVPLPGGDSGRLLAQFARFGLVGVAATLFSAAVYAGLEFLGLNPFLAMTLSYVAAMPPAYFAHDRFTFADPAAPAAAPEAGRLLRFLAVNIAGFSLNQFFVWLLVVQLGLPGWTPVLPMIFVTTLVTFALQRWWVFNGRS
jgi:putative flippase GtrA